MKTKLKFTIVILILGIASLLFITTVNRDSLSFRSNWRIISQGETPDSFSIPSLHFFDSNKGVMISTFNVYETNNGGKNLESIYESDFSTFNSVLFNAEKSGWIAGSKNESPLLLKSEDEGLSWQEINFNKLDKEKLSGKFSTFNDVCFDSSGKLWIVGDGGIIETTVNKLDSNLLNVIFTEENLYSVFCDNDEVWSVGKKGIILHYQNGWTKKNIDEKYIFTKVKAINKDIWILGGSGDQGIVLVSQDGGKSWANMTPERANILFDLHIQDEKGWLIGANGKIFYTNNDGKSWMESSSPTQSDLGEIFVLDSKNIWISGSKSTILKLKE